MYRSVCSLCWHPGVLVYTDIGVLPLPEWWDPVAAATKASADAKKSELSDVDKLIQGVAKAAKGELTTEADNAQSHFSEWVMAYHHYQ